MTEEILECKSAIAHIAQGSWVKIATKFVHKYSDLEASERPMILSGSIFYRNFLKLFRNLHLESSEFSLVRSVSITIPFEIWFRA